MGSLHEEEIKENLAADVENEADVDGGTTTAFTSEVPGVERKTGGDYESERAGIDGQY